MISIVLQSSNVVLFEQVKLVVFSEDERQQQRVGGPAFYAFRAIGCVSV